MPLVSIIMPSLNVRQYIEKCLQSVVDQTLQNIEIICIDAGSTDGTREIINKYALKDNRVKVIDSEIKSYGYQVNLGMYYASGKYIAIVETDDWIELNMFSILYELAEREKLDYIVADFDFVYELRNGNLARQRYKQFSNNDDIYGKVIGEKIINKLRASDYLLWKGIYNKKFIIDNNIRLHESPKAAFQDMGFLQQVKTYAKRAMYIDESFYRYRVGRKEASSCNTDGLIFYKKEFEWINNETNILKVMDKEYQKYYYQTMSISFVTKYAQVVKALDWNYEDSRLTVPYEWFKEQLYEKIKHNFIKSDIYDDDTWNQLTTLIESGKKYTLHLKAMYDIRLSKISELKKYRVIIFGCGKIGTDILKMCDINNINVEMFVDNDVLLQKSGYCGYKVISVAQLSKIINYSQYAIIIAMKKDKEKVVDQMLQYDIRIRLYDSCFFYDYE